MIANTPTATAATTTSFNSDKGSFLPKTNNLTINKYKMAKNWAMERLEIQEDLSSLFSELESSYQNYLQNQYPDVISESLASNELAFFLKIYTSLVSNIPIKTRRTAKGIRYKGVGLKTAW